MPAEAVHLTAYREAMASPRTSTYARRTALRFEDGVRLGAVLVDLPYFDRFPTEVARYLLELPARPSPWGNRLHDEGPVDLLVQLVKLARARRDPTLSAVALGLASHAAIDRALHPLINALATRETKRSSLDHGSLHREVEKFQSVCFHEEYAGRDAMGTPAMGRTIGVDLAYQLDRHVVGASILRAFAAAFGEAPTLSTFARWGRGYRSYVRLLASPLGALMVPERQKPRGRERFLSGTWGEFGPLLEKAITASIVVIDATANALSADERDEPAAIEALLLRLPRGTIDDRGDGVDVERPFLVAGA